MTGIYSRLQPKRIRLQLYGLIFFVFAELTGCHTPEGNTISIRWQGNRATGLIIPQRLVPSVPADSLGQRLTVRRAGIETAMLGTYRLNDDDVVFSPLIPFTRGLRYGVWLNNKRLSDIVIPDLAPNDRPTLLAVYPSSDSLPDNLLKIYLRFSRPMREGQSRQYVTLLKNGTDTLPGVFLDLQPELWNADRTLLTLWLDPGRIKRDLDPNKRLGAPLQPGVRYQVVVSAAWPDEQGASLGTSTLKRFVTGQRDSLCPTPARWMIRQPQSDSKQPLEVAFGEALDYSLLTETLRIVRENGTPVPGTWQLGDKENRSLFTPGGAWQPGRYRLRIETRLEDLAGNNLNRPFDRDVTRKTTGQPAQPFVEIPFSVQ